MKTILLTLCAAFIVLAAHAQNPSVYVEDGQYKCANIAGKYTVRYMAINEDDDTFYIILKNTSAPLAQEKDSCRLFYGPQNHLKESTIITSTPKYNSFDVQTKDFNVSFARTLFNTSELNGDTDLKTVAVNE